MKWADLKKMLVAVLSCLFLFGSVACGGTPSGDTDDENSSVVTPGAPSDDETDDSEDDNSEQGDEGETSGNKYRIYYNFVLAGIQAPQTCFYDESVGAYYQEVTYMQAYELPSFDKFNNYQFSKWVITGTQTEFESGNSYSLKENIYLTAIWIDRTTDDNWA